MPLFYMEYEIESSFEMQNLTFKYMFIKDDSVQVYILSVNTISTPAFPSRDKVLWSVLWDNRFRQWYNKVNGF